MLYIQAFVSLVESEPDHMYDIKSFALTGGYKIHHQDVGFMSANH